jgi:hypothetical protein
MSLLSHIESPGNDIHLSAVIGVQVIMQQRLKLILNHMIFSNQFLFVVHMQ